jgi:hypothetical protein
MTIYLNPNSISGVSSVTAAASPDPTAAVKFYNSQGTETLGNPIVSNLTASSINGGQLAGMRNRIINGDMRISQRGTSFTGINVNTTTKTYVMDRWFVGGGTIDNIKRIRVDLVNDAPTEEFQYSLKLAVTTTNIDIPSDENILIQQRIEGYNVRDLIGKPFTLSFWVKSSLPGIYSINFRSNYDELQPNLTNSYVVNYTISTTNWEYKTITVNPGLPNESIWNFKNGIGLRVSFQLSAGTLYRTSTTDSWLLNGEFLSSTSAINNFFSAQNTFSVTGVQLEPGNVATPFEHRFYGQELALCKRYAQWVPFNQQFFSNAVGGGETHESTMTWPVEMRTNPNAASLTADPNTTQFVLNNGFNAISRLTPYGGSAVLSSSGQGSSYVVGYRSFLSAEL